MSPESNPAFQAAWEAHSFSFPLPPFDSDRELFRAGYEARDAEVERLRARVARLQWLCSQTLQMLPRRRDWLDPDIEREMQTEGAEARAALQPEPYPNACKYSPSGIHVGREICQYCEESIVFKVQPEQANA